MKKDVLFENVFAKYAEQTGLNVSLLRFTYDGQHIQGNSVTPNSLNMEDGDIIQVFANQQGGNVMG